MSLGDFLTYLFARANRHPMLSPASWDLLNIPFTDAARYVMAWVAPSAAVCMHSGSNTAWFATGGFNTIGDAMAIVTNTGDGADLARPVERPILDWLNDV